MIRRMMISVAVAAALVMTGAPANAQKPVSLGGVVSETFTIEAIDHSTRRVTLRDKDGFVEDVICGPEVTRFDALKVGDRVTFQYHESLVTAIRRPGAAPKAAESAAVTRSPGATPGGTISQQMTVVVGCSPPTAGCSGAVATEGCSTTTRRCTARPTPSATPAANAATAARRW